MGGGGTGGNILSSLMGAGEMAGGIAMGPAGIPLDVAGASSLASGGAGLAGLTGQQQQPMGSIAPQLQRAQPFQMQGTGQQPQGPGASTASPGGTSIGAPGGTTMTSPQAGAAGAVPSSITDPQIRALLTRILAGGAA